MKPRQKIISRPCVSTSFASYIRLLPEVANWADKEIFYQHQMNTRQMRCVRNSKEFRRSTRILTTPVQPSRFKSNIHVLVIVWWCQCLLGTQHEVGCPLEWCAVSVLPVRVISRAKRHSIYPCGSGGWLITDMASVQIRVARDVRVQRRLYRRWYRTVCHKISSRIRRKWRV
jgi:hypothetical protein